MNRTHAVLGYLGLIPFLLLSAGVALGWEEAEFPLLSYASLILTFLGGALWTMSREHPQDTTTAIVSNVFMLLAWGALLLQQVAMSLVLLALLFLALLAFELYKFSHTYDANYLRMRVALTTVVSFCLFFASFKTA